MELKYKRVLLKISGEAFCSGQNADIDFSKVDQIADLISVIRMEGAEVVIVNGAGNLFRGTKQGKEISREDADYIGMFATILNSLALKAVLKGKNIPAVVYSAWEIEGVIPSFDIQKAKDDLEGENVVISTAGIGKPFFTTDTAGVQRAVDLSCDLMIKASTVDGVYSSDPKEDASAQKYERIVYDEILEKDLKILDRSAVEIAQENNLKIVVCEFSSGNVLKVLGGGKVGTQIFP